MGLICVLFGVFVCGDIEIERLYIFVYFFFREFIMIGFGEIVECVSLVFC